MPSKFGPTNLKPQSRPVAEQAKVETPPVAIPAVDEGNVGGEPIESVNSVAEEIVVKQKIVNVELLNVREAPNAKANVVKFLPKGTKVEVLGETGDFTKIGHGLYVMTKFLK